MFRRDKEAIVLVMAILVLLPTFLWLSAPLYAGRPPAAQPTAGPSPRPDAPEQPFLPHSGPWRDVARPYTVSANPQEEPYRYFLFAIGAQSAVGKFRYPRGVAVGPDGTVYVADAGNHRIQRFTADGRFLGAWGSYGSGAGEFDSPRGVAVGPDGTVYVADTDNDRIQRFTADGRFLGAWGSYGSGEGAFNWPYGVAVGPDGTVYVADAGNDRVQAFSTAYPDTWRGEFYANRWLAEAPVAISHTATLDFDWGPNAPMPNVPADRFSSRWLRFVYFEEGRYHFTVFADDGVRLWVDDRLLIEQWQHPQREIFSAFIHLKQGYHRIRLEQYEYEGWARIGLSWFPVPENDDIDNAVEIQASSAPFTRTYTMDTTHATTEDDDPWLPCVGGPRYHTVWYQFTPLVNGTLHLNTNGSDYDTVLAVWQGERGNLTSVGCDDDSGEGTRSQLELDVSAGQPYYIEVAGFSDVSYGALTLHVRFIPLDTTPPTISDIQATNDVINRRGCPGAHWTVISANVRDVSGIEWVRLYYTSPNGTTWQWKYMEAKGEGRYEAPLGDFTQAGTVSYYVRARDLKGNIQTSNTYRITVQSCDTLAPTINTVWEERDPVYASGCPKVHTTRIRADVWDSGESGLAWMRLYYQEGPQGPWQYKTMEPVGGTTHEAVLGPFSRPAEVIYYIKARDQAGNETETAPHTLQVKGCNSVPILWWGYTPPCLLYEPNDDFEHAWGPLASGRRYRAWLCRGEGAGSRDMDFYFFEARGAGEAVLTLRPPPALVGHVGLYVYTASQDRLCGWGPITQSLFQQRCALPGPGRYFVVVLAAEGTGDDVHPYELQVTFP